MSTTGAAYQVEHLASSLAAELSIGTGIDQLVDHLEIDNTNLERCNIDEMKAKISSCLSNPDRFCAEVASAEERSLPHLAPTLELLAAIQSSPSILKDLHSMRGGELMKSAISMPSGLNIADGTMNLSDHLSASSASLASTSATGRKAVVAELKESLKTSRLSTSREVAMPAVLVARLPSSVSYRSMDIPPLPKWLDNVCLLQSYDNSWMMDASENIAHKLVMEQEHIIIDDLLVVMLGLEGVYIRSKRKHEKLEFKIEHSLDKSLTEMVKRFIPLLVNYDTIQRYLECGTRYTEGKVNQSLCAAINSVMDDYRLFVSQLDKEFRKGQLTIQRMWLLVQSVVTVLANVAGLIIPVKKGMLRGGSLLTMLHQRLVESSKDAEQARLYMKLTEAASVPYFRMLHTWLSAGVIVDSAAEFFIERGRDTLGYVDSADEWTKKYLVHSEIVPQFLRQYVTEIANTGKYLDIVNQNSQTSGRTAIEVPEITYTTSDVSYGRIIREANIAASQMVVNLIMREKQLLSHFDTLKCFLLLRHGDVIDTFSIHIEEELKKTVTDIKLDRLQSLWEVSVETSSAKHVLNKENVSVGLSRDDLPTHLFRILKKGVMANVKLEEPLTGLEALTLNYKVEWPISLVINISALAHYQIIFRFLFYCKHVERQLSAVWARDKVIDALPETSSAYARAYLIRVKMLHFVQTLLYYTTVSIIEPQYHAFALRLTKVNTIDDIMTCHQTFLTNCLKNSMLTNVELIRLVHKLFSNCILFTNYIQRITSAVLSTGNGDTNNSFNKTLAEISFSESFIAKQMAVTVKTADFAKSIETFDKNFTEQLVHFLIELMRSDEQKLQNIVDMINYNGVYTAALEAESQAETAKLNGRASGSGFASSS